MTEGITGLSCVNCQWADQCGGNEICEYFDSLEDMDWGIQNERDEYAAAYISYRRAMECDAKVASFFIC